MDDAGDAADDDCRPVHVRQDRSGHRPGSGWGPARTLPTSGPVSRRDRPRHCQYPQCGGRHRSHRRSDQSSGAHSRDRVHRARQPRSGRLAGVRLVSAHREGLQVAGPCLARLHRRGAIRPPRPRQGRGRDVPAHDPTRCQVHRDPGRAARHDDLPIPLLLASKPGSGGGDQHGTPSPPPTPGRVEVRAPVRAHRHDRGDDLFGDRRLLHHPGDGCDPVRRGQDRDQLRDGRSAGPPAPGRRRVGPLACGRSHRRRRTGRAGTDRFGCVWRQRGFWMAIGARSEAHMGAPVLRGHHRRDDRRDRDQLRRDQPDHRPRPERRPQRDHRRAAPRARHVHLEQSSGNG